MRTKIFILGLLAIVLALGFGADEALADGAIAGVVIDADGEPVGGEIVSVMGQARRGERPFRARVESNEDGTFGFRGVPAGRYSVIAGARELGRAAARVAVADDEVSRVELQLHGPRGRRGGGGGDDEERPDPGSVVGQITNADGEAVAGAFVAIKSADRRNRGRGLRTRADDNGMFSFDAVPAGNYRIMAGARGVGRARGEVEIIAGEESEVNLQLQGR